MRQWLALGALLSAMACAEAAEVVREIDWTGERDRAKGFEVLAPSPGTNFAHARVTNQTTKPVTVRVLLLDHPGIGQATYAITGQVRYENVQGGAHLEMWSHFPDGGRYFTRTLAAQGPMAQLHGTSGWRAFVLPFNSLNATLFPTAITMHVVLPSRGTVELGPLKLTQYAPGEDPLRQPREPRFGFGLLVLTSVSMAGPLVGTLGALIGILALYGKSRRLVMGLDTAGIVLGVALALVGIGVLAADYAYFLWFPYLLAGTIAMAVFLGIRPRLRRRYDELELRRMSALDAP